jgi:tyrosinase
MADVYGSPSDPIFWMHHTFIDQSFWTWQGTNSTRLSTIDGIDHNGDPLTLDTVLDMGGIRPNVTIGQIVDTLGGVVIGNETFCYQYNY